MICTISILIRVFGSKDSHDLFGTQLNGGLDLACSPMDTVFSDKPEN